MIESLMYLIGAPAWLLGGAYTAKHAIAVAERHYLNLSRDACEKDRTLVPQDRMDTDDWIGASFFAGLAFIGFPIIAVAWTVNKVLNPVKAPVAAFLEPPIQKAHREHVVDLTNQKQLILGTARMYQDVLDWKPEDHPDRVRMKDELEREIKDQMSVLMRMTDPDRASDTDFLDRAKFEVKQLTAGGK